MDQRQAALAQLLMQGGGQPQQQPQQFTPEQMMMLQRMAQGAPLGVPTGQPVPGLNGWTPPDRGAPMARVVAGSR